MCRRWTNAGRFCPLGQRPGIGDSAGERFCLVGRGRFGGHRLGFLPCCVPTACGFLLRGRTVRDRWLAEPCCFPQEGNVQRGKANQGGWAKQESTYGAGHRRKFCTARLASMAHFVSVFCPSSDSCVDIAASYGQREQWSLTRWLHRTGSHIKSQSCRQPPRPVCDPAADRKLQDITIQMCGKWDLSFLSPEFQGLPTSAVHQGDRGDSARLGSSPAAERVVHGDRQ